MYVLELMEWVHSIAELVSRGIVLSRMGLVVREVRCKGGLSRQRGIRFECCRYKAVLLFLRRVFLLHCFSPGNHGR